jgi:hypothetical protein
MVLSSLKGEYTVAREMLAVPGSHACVCVHSERFIQKAEAGKTADES